MSNANVGSVYDHIIQEVINAVRVDFEENGVEDGVLDELRKGWQQKLSQLNVAQFPWDPKPEPPPTAANNAQTAAPPVSQQVATSYTQATLSPQTSSQPLSHQGSLHPGANGMGIKPDPGMVKPEPGIKQEPGTGMSQTGVPAYNAANAGRGGIAAQRAAQALESNYGPRAAASISAIQSGMAQQMNPAQLAQRPGQPPQQQQQHQAPQQQQQPNAQQQYRQGVAATMQQRLQSQQGAHTNGPNGLPTAQVDGSSDSFEGVLLRRDANGHPVEMGRVEIDNLIHAQIASRAKQIEGGGLMLPLKEATRHRSIANKSKATAGGPSQVDGPDDLMKDEDLDEDAINSDLDDSEEEKDEEEEDDDSMGHMMLCMYDKVQRVKNKWKCTLKDGVLTVNGREYVFHKATGEYEW
ncbi:transcription factor IIA, alpha/beta subunit [Lasiosphaeria miniovina]|uniref:Transcription initiation factor IIA large subunit n=1 Tax=Lasiosphaeria miniovina TaxID=1954250 RepID=A0AA40EGD0_9PEZI|nr:transcription factor IIA, alpha/beta subunit [Lasiosphaeria miniovina]KAK0734358.1 transcription factor IIA, alpha/beta subunit [Lasiosphaeria miniovina]